MHKLPVPFALSLQRPVLSPGEVKHSVAANASITAFSTFFSEVIVLKKTKQANAEISTPQLNRIVFVFTTTRN